MKIIPEYILERFPSTSKSEKDIVYVTQDLLKEKNATSLSFDNDEKFALRSELRNEVVEKKLSNKQNVETTQPVSIYIVLLMMIILLIAFIFNVGELKRMGLPIIFALPIVAVCYWWWYHWLKGGK